MPLARGKSTVVRVYVEATAVYAWLVRVVSVYLYATDGASGMSLVCPGLWSSAGPLDVTFDTPCSGDVDRGNGDHTANFLLPPYWVDRGTLTLVAFVKTYDGQVETDYTDNWMMFEDSPQQTFSFTPTKSVDIVYWPVDYRVTAPDENPNLPSPDDLLNGSRFLEKIYPFPDLSDPVIWREKLGEPLFWDIDLTQPDGHPGFNQLLSYINEWYLLWELCAPLTCPDFLCALYANAGTGIGIAYIPGHVFVAHASRPVSIAHELGHNHGLHHSFDEKENERNPWWFTDAQNSSQTFGFDVQHFGTQGNWLPEEKHNIVKIPALDETECYTKHGAIESYYTYRWIAPWEWEILMEACDPAAMASYPFSASSTVQSSTPSLLISGVIHKNNTGSLDPIFQLPSFLNTTPPSGPYTVELRGPPPAEPLLYSQSFNLSEATDELQPDPNASSFFVLNLPFITGTYSVSLWNKSISPPVLLDKITASANPPQVVMTYPNGGEIIGDSLNVTWIAADPDGDPLTFELFYSNDNGATWNPIAQVSQSEPMWYEFDTSSLPGGSQCLVRVLASDGFHTSEDQSDSVFSVPLKGPRDLIATCQHNTYYNEPVGGNESDRRVPFDAFIILKGSAFDPEDGVLNGTALTWTSDINGTLGIGRVLTVMDLIPGEHNITLTATDSDGNNATKSFTITVELHDIAITDVTKTKTVIGQGYTLDINATVENQGNLPATFNVTVYANTTEIETQEMNLTSGNTTTIVFTWNTTGFAKGNYTISAYAWPVPGDINTADNTLPDGTVKVGVPGDLNGDGKCNLSDLVKVAGKFGKNKGDPGYDPNYDMNDDGKINLSDLVRVARHFGTTDP